MAFDRVARRGGGADQILAFTVAGNDHFRKASRSNQAAMAHRARLSGSQTRGRARAFRSATFAWLPPPPYAVHRGLRFPGLREGDDSPLGISFHQAVQETCGFQRLPTQRLRHCDPNVTSRTRLRRCDEDSSSPSPGTSHAVPVAFGNRSVFFCDAVRLVLTPWGTFTSYSLPAFLAHSGPGQTAKRRWLRETSDMSRLANVLPPIETSRQSHRHRE